MRKTAEPRENKIGPRADCQNKSDVSRHSNARPDSAKMSIVGHGLARSLTSLTRFGTSFWALILAACGGGGGGGGPTISGSSTAGPSTGGPSTGGIMASNIGSPAAPKMVDLSGFAYNRPLAGGEVWLDVNDNQQIDAADYRVPGKVDSKGEYRGQVPETLASLPVMVDTTTTEYRGQLPDVLLAPEGSRVVSPFTHGLATGVITRDDIPENFNPLTDNPYAETQNPEQQAANAIV